jgi:2-keto-4-pentenoate hydratase/2-oxohepta-3-ene-1,7-dioic acid hydratase in catechol pathway
MKLLTFYNGPALMLGLKTENGVLDVSTARRALGRPAPETVESLLQGGEAARRQLQALADAAVLRPDLWLEESNLRLGPCVPNPPKIICIGLNYRRHAVESNLPIPAVPILFSKFHNVLAAHGDAVMRPGEDAIQMDYEAELVIVIGRKCRNVSKAEALDYVFGYCNGNDVSDRGLQFRTNQWLLGKTSDGWLPIGPYLVSADEAGDPAAMRVRCWVNGEPRQDSNTSDMIFDCREIISYISRYMTLEPGDIISTGTPEGVAFGKPEPKPWLQKGDEMVVEIGPLGRLVNRVDN